MSWLFISDDVCLYSANKSDKEYMERQKKVLTKRKKKHTLVTHISNHKPKK